MAVSYLDGEEGGEGVEERRVGVRFGQGRRVPVDHVLALCTHDTTNDTANDTRHTHTRHTR
jgi:hypothetical protein